MKASLIWILMIGCLSESEGDARVPLALYGFWCLRCVGLFLRPIGNRVPDLERKHKA